MKRFEGVRIIPINMGAFRYGAAITLPGVGIVVGKAYINNLPLLRHEMGHILQYKKWGFWYFWRYVAFSSLKSAHAANSGKTTHQHSWTEWSANRLAYIYFNQPEDWDFRCYPIAPPSKSKQYSLPDVIRNKQNFNKEWFMT